MQDLKTSKTRRPWYQRAIEMTTLWKTFSNSPSNSNSTLIKTLKPTEIQASSSSSSSSSSNPNKQNKLRKSSSLKVTTSLTGVCLCGSISSYIDVFNVEAPPRRSYTYPRSKPFPPPPPINAQEIRVLSARLSTQGRRRSSVFRGKSLMDDVLMRRFVMEEEAMVQVVNMKRRNQIEVIKRRAKMRNKKLGPSPLSKMVLAQDDFYLFS